jgi:hypothetical protein
MIESIAIPGTEDYRLRAMVADLFDLQTYDPAKSGFFVTQSAVVSISQPHAKV